MTSLKELMDMKGRVALITGATGGLGKIFSETLAELGADLLLVDRPGTDIKDFAISIATSWNISVKEIYCDLEDQKSRSNLAQEVNTLGRLNVLINNAAFVGTSELTGWAVPFEKQNIETWRRAFEVNLTAVFDLCQSFAPILKNAKGASIINVASIYGLLGPDWRLYEGTTMGNPAAYAASKGGLIQLTRWLATTIAPHVRVNAISPGGVFREQPEVFVNRYETRTPLGRMASEDDFRGVVAFLASDMSRYVTGQNLAVDGGWVAW
ncbi:MAG: SDR family oxidoreductase [Desulfamplus sp.]|nr:SDR family oxidoreductase [Desulfamplus sp.]